MVFLCTFMNDSCCMVSYEYRVCYELMSMKACALPQSNKIAFDRHSLLNLGFHQVVGELAPQFDLLYAPPPPPQPTGTNFHPKMKLV